MKPIFLKYCLLCYLAILCHIANAGGSYFPIQITDIKTISDKEHHISFVINDTQNWQYDEFKSCESVDWIVDYQEWEMFHSIILILKNIVTLNHSKRQLTTTIETLKNNNNNKNYIILTMGSSGYFQINPNNHCQIFSKNLIISEQKINNTIVLEPTRHHSKLVNQ